MPSEEAPAKLPPPWIHSITGRRDFGGHSAVQTFRYRQSSLTPSPFCMHRAAKLVASRMPVHVGTGAGSRQRRSPTGGAAKGIPLKTAPPSFRRLPRMFPPVTMAEGGSCAGMINENSASGAMMATVRVGFMELSGKNDTPHFGPGKADGQLERKNTRGS